MVSCCPRASAKSGVVCQSDPNCNVARRIEKLSSPEKKSQAGCPSGGKPLRRKRSRFTRSNAPRVGIKSCRSMVPIVREHHTRRTRRQSGRRRRRTTVPYIARPNDVPIRLNAHKQSVGIPVPNLYAPAAAQTIGGLVSRARSSE